MHQSASQANPALWIGGESRRHCLCHQQYKWNDLNRSQSQHCVAPNNKLHLLTLKVKKNESYRSSFTTLEREWNGRERRSELEIINITTDTCL